MANNISVKDGSAADQVLKTTDNGGVHTPHHNVDTLPALPAGTNAIGKLAANSGVDIGDVDVASIAAGDNNIGNVDIVTVPAPLSTMGGGTEATAQRVTIATDSTGVLSVDDNGGALTVDGTVTANLSATDNAVLDTIDAVLDTIKTDTAAIVTAVQLIDNSIAGSETQVDIVAALPAGTNAIGKLAANSGVDIGDVDVTSIVPGTGATNLGKAEDGAHTSGDVGVMALGVRNEGHDDFSGTDKDYVPIAVDATGDVYVNVRHALPAGTAAIGSTKDNGPAQTLTRTYTANADFSTAREITAAPTGGQKIVAMDLFVSTDTDCLLTIQMETSANVLAAAYVYARTPLQISLRGFIKADAADKKLLMKTSVAAAGVCTAVYFSEA